MRTDRNGCDIAVVGAGAAGMAAAIFAAQELKDKPNRILLLEGAKKPGAKILVSGGGRCNVTNKNVSETDFWGGSRAIIRNVLRQFDERRTLEWFESMWVRLKLEPSKKYFPVTDRAQTVLDALLNRVRELRVDLIVGTRVADIERSAGGFSIRCQDGRDIAAGRVIVATGGLALPKSGSDGVGLSIMQRLGHTVVPTTPALTGLVLRAGREPGGRFAEFAGVTMDARLRLFVGNSSKPRTELFGSLVFTHFGISGPVAMDMSRHWLRARLEDGDCPLRVTLGLPSFESADAADRSLLHQARVHPQRRISTILSEQLPERIAGAINNDLGGDVPMARLSRESRRAIAGRLSDMPLDVTGTRGYSHAEATAGGIDLQEIDWRTMESRKAPGLYLCGEILDVDGRIGGFNFQWAWSSGHVAGRGAAANKRDAKQSPLSGEMSSAAGG